MKRGQFQHVFTFLMLMIIAGVVLLLGYRFLSSVLSDACEVEQASFVDQFQKDLKQYASYGSFHSPAVTAPCGAEAICFVDARHFKDEDKDGIWEQDDSFTPDYVPGKSTVIDEEVRNPSSPPHNVFIIHSDKTTRYVDFFADKITLDDSAKPLCINSTSGKFRLGFEGRGKTVLITDQTLST